MIAVSLSGRTVPKKSVGSWWEFVKPTGTIICPIRRLKAFEKCFVM